MLRLCVVLIGCFLVAQASGEEAATVAGGVQPAEASAEEIAEIGRELSEIIRREMADKNIPAFSIALVDGSRTLWAEGFGHADPEQEVPATAETVYRVGSLSKLVTDLAVMQLVEQGRLDLDGDVRRYLPNFSPNNPFDDQAITLRQLMSHRSGLVREPPVGNYFDPTEPSLAKTVASLNETSLVYTPDEKTKYSNAAIAVVGAVLEEQWGEPFSEAIARRVLQPLGMSGSSFALTPAVSERLATGWMWTYDGRGFEAPQFALGMVPAGNLYSSVDDLAKLLSWILADESGDVLERKTLLTMITPAQGEDGKPLQFGIGFHVDEFEGHQRVRHGGAVYGFSTEIAALPGRNVGVVAVASLDGCHRLVSRITDHALHLLLAAQDATSPPGYRSTGPIPPQRAKDLVGTYRSEDGNVVEVNELDGDVYLQQGAFRYELRATSEEGRIVTDDVTGFGTKVALDDAANLVIEGKTYVRVGDEPPAGAPQRWRGLIGEYGWDHNTLYILERHGRLVALIEWFYYYPLTELSENEFAFPDYGLYHGETLQFTRDASGRATRVVAAEVAFDRRDVGTRDGETFKITPVESIDVLRPAALAASPPTETGNFRESDLVELIALDPTIQLDIRYATTNNFMGERFYEQPRAFMQRPAAEAVVRAHRRLKERGLGLLIHDAYRPWHVTKMFWDATPSEMKQFVANPAYGSRHNRGCAVDLTLYDLESGEPIQIVAGYDEFSSRSFPLYPGGTSRQRWYRDLLRRTMEGEGFSVYEFEWWHFDYQDWKQYRMCNATFEELLEP